MLRCNKFDAPKIANAPPPAWSVARGVRLIPFRFLDKSRGWSADRRYTSVRPLRGWRLGEGAAPRGAPLSSFRTPGHAFCADRTARDRFQKAADTVFVDPIRTVGKFRTESRNGSSPAAVELIKLKAHPVAGFMIEAASLGAIVMKATDVMVANVATVGQNASVQEIANVLLANRISAVPVVNERDELVGIVSEGDLIRRVESPFEVQRSWWLEQLLERTPVTSNIKPTTGKAADIMSPRVVTATPETSIREIAALLEKNGIKRVPIVRNKKVLGIVSRANLVQALASALKEVKASTATSDAMVREEIMARLDAESWSRFLPFNVIVHDGRVELWGVVDSETTKEAINLVAEGTLGVRSINNNIMVRPYRATTVPGNQQAERAAQPANPK